jgi:hypothetical protein
VHATTVDPMGHAAWLAAQEYVRFAPNPPPETQHTSLAVQLHPPPPSAPAPPSCPTPPELPPAPDEDALELSAFPPSERLLDVVEPPQAAASAKQTKGTMALFITTSPKEERSSNS